MQKRDSDEILVILTGGTICSLPEGEGGKNQSDAKKTRLYLEENFRKSASPYRETAKFSYRRLPQDLLSENMTVEAQNGILDIFRKEALSRYAGVIVLHGTDTLAYTAALLSLALAGIPCPVCLVSAQLALKKEVKVAEGTEEKTILVDEERSNGYANFRAAVELILNGILPNVYAVYRNEGDGMPLLHLGAHLLQCPNGSDDFHSASEMRIPEGESARHAGVRFASETCYYKNVAALSGGVLLLSPYTGLSYGALRLDGFLAVVHGTYHSESVCIGRPANPEKKAAHLTLEEVAPSDRPYSILSLLSECKGREIPVFLAPCNGATAKYGTTANAIREGAHPVRDITLPAAYAKALLGLALGRRGAALLEFFEENINGESVAD